MRRRSFYSLAVLLTVTILLTFLGQLNANVLVQTRNGTELDIYAIEIIYVGSQRQNIGEPISAEVTMDRINVANRFYLFRTAQPVDGIAVQIQNDGALGLLTVSSSFNVPGFQKYRYSDQKFVHQINIPIFEVGSLDGTTLLNLFEDDQILNVTFIAIDQVNTWDDIFYNPGYQAWIILIILFSGVNIALCIWKLRVFISFYGGFRSSLPCYVLLIELFGNVIRVIYYVNLAFYNVFPTNVSGIFSVISYPFTISSYLLFTLYWQEMMTSSSVVVHPFIVKLRIPFFVICAALLTLDIVRIILLYTTTWEGMPFVNSVIIMVLLTALIAFYLATTIKLLMRLKTSKASGRRVQLKKITLKVCIGVGFLFVFLLMSILFVTRLTVNPQIFTVCWNLIYTFLNGASMMNVLAFEIPAKKGSSQSKRTTSKPGDTNSINRAESNIA